MSPSTAVATCSVIWVVVSSQPKIEAAATMNNTIAVVSMVSIETLISMRKLSVRYQTKPRNSAQTTAATAASVGVKRPVAMPPIRRTGVISAMKASNFISRSTTNTTISGSPNLRKPPSSRSPQRMNSAAAAMTTASSSTRARPMRFQANGMSRPYFARGRSTRPSAS